MAPPTSRAQRLYVFVSWIRSQRERSEGDWDIVSLGGPEHGLAKVPFLQIRNISKMFQVWADIRDIPKHPRRRCDALFTTAS
jgi:hypothetical protein